MESIEKFKVTDTMLWEKVKNGLTKKWLENEATTNDLETLVEIYNNGYDGGIFDNLEVAINNAFRNVDEAFYCGEFPQGNYDCSDNWFKVQPKDNMLYSYDEQSLLDYLIDEMSRDISYLSRKTDDNKVDEDNLYRDIVKDIALDQRYYTNNLENINDYLFKYIEKNTLQGYGIVDLKENPLICEEDKQTIKIVPKSEELSELVVERNNRVSELLNTNSWFLKGALYNAAIKAQAQNLYDILYKLYTCYGIDNEFIESHREEFDEVNLNLAKIGEFIVEQ